MRVTNSMLVSHFMNNLNTNLTKLDKLQGQMATGRKYAHISDDPVSVIYSQQANYKLDRLYHYKGNVDTAQNWLTSVETSVMELNDLVKSAYEACVDAATDVKTPTDKTSASEYIGQLKEQILSTLNSTYGDKYIFGGYNTTGYIDPATGKTIPPFTFEERDCVVPDLDSDGNFQYDPGTGDLLTVPGKKEVLCYNGQPVSGSYPGDTDLAALQKDTLTYDVGVGVEMPVTINGLDLIMLGTHEVSVPAASDPPGGYVTETQNANLFDLLNDLYNCVKEGKPAEEINKFITPLQEAQNHLLALAAEIGGRTDRLEILENRYEIDEINYIQMKSDAEDIDQGEVIMNYKMAEAVYKAALSTGAYIIQPTLMDFLR